MSEDAKRQLTDIRNALVESEARFFNVVHSSPDGIVVLDESGVICFANKASHVLFNKSKNTMLGHCFGFPLVSGDKSIIEIPGKHGTPTIAEMRVVKITWEQKPALLASLRDVSSHAQLESQLNTTNRELKQFAYAVSHDIKAPLRNVQSIADWIMEDNAASLDPKVVTDLTLMKTNITQIQTLVDGLLQFTEIGHLGDPSKVVNLSSALEEALSNIQSDIVDSGAEVASEVLPDVLGHRSLLVILFQNLIGNSLKYCNETPAITITAVQKSQNWKVGITDNGIGIEPDYWEKIFMAFERLHTHAEYQGSGIGLATCRKIMEIHKGQIWVESVSEAGSTFNMLFPVVD